MRGRPKAELVLSESEREQLQAWSRRRKTAQALALRSRIVLSCASGTSNKVVAETLGVTPQTVTKWRARFLKQRLRRVARRTPTRCARSVSMSLRHLGVYIQ